MKNVELNYAHVSYNYYTIIDQNVRWRTISKTNANANVVPLNYLAQLVFIYKNIIIL